MTTSANGMQVRDPNQLVVLDTRVVTGTGGGPDKTILNSPRFLAGTRYRMLCAYMYPPGDPGFEHLRQRAETLQAPLLAIADRGSWDWRVFVELLHICRRERVRIWHGHDYKSNALGLLVRRFWPMRLVTTVHGWVTETRRTPLYYNIDRLCLPYYESVICVSDDLREHCLAAGVPPERCVVLENGIDTGHYSRRESKVEAKRKLGISPERLLIGAVGRLSTEKGFDLLIRAADQLIWAGFDVDLCIAGEGDQMKPLRALIEALGRAERIRLLGYLGNAIKFYEAMDVFALCSFREGLPNVLLEAMALEVPIVATRVAGVPRLVQDGTNGLLIEPGSVDELASALGRLLGDDGLRASLGRAGRHTVESRYSFRLRMDRLRALYDTLLETPAPRTLFGGGGVVR